MVLVVSMKRLEVTTEEPSIFPKLMLLRLKGKRAGTVVARSEAVGEGRKGKEREKRKNLTRDINKNERRAGANSDCFDGVVLVTSSLLNGDIFSFVVSLAKVYLPLIFFRYLRCGWSGVLPFIFFFKEKGVTIYYYFYSNTFFFFFFFF